MSLLDLYGQMTGPVTPPLVQTPSTPGERFGAEFDAQLSPDRWFNLEASRRSKWQETIDALHTATGEAFDNPLSPATPADIAKPGYNPALLRKEREQRIIDAHRNLVRDVGADLPDPETIDQRIGEEGRAIRGRAAELQGTGNGLAAFAGGALAPTPENIIGLMIPPSRAVLGAVPIARGFLYNVGREAAFQAGANAGLTAIGEGLDVLARSETGTAPDTGEIAANIGMSAAGGAALGGAFHALHLAPRALLERWNRLPEDVRANAPLEVRDSMHTIAADVLYSGRNRFGLPDDLHERYQGNALDAVIRGRPVDLPTPADTSMTALGRVLQGEAAAATPEISGLPRTKVDLPSHEDVVSFIAAEAPKDWQRLADARTELAQVEARLAKIEGDPAWVVAPGKPDAATQRVLDDLEGQLKRARNDATRADLERRIEGIREGFSPATQHAKLTADREELASEVGNLMGQFARRFDDVNEGMLDVGARIEKGGARPAANADLVPDGALRAAQQRADFERQIRTVRELQAQNGQAPVRREPVKATAQNEALQPSPELKAAADQALEGKNLGDFKRVAMKELAALDEEAKDATAALKCAGAGATA